MTRVLVVEDSKFFGSMLSKRIERDLQFEAVWATTLAQTRNILETDKRPFALALLDLTLPDSPRGEIVDFIMEHKIPSVVLTAELSEEVRQQIWKKRVVDYVVKDNPVAIDYAIALLGRLTDNPNIKVLVVDDSKTIRNHTVKLLRVHQYQVLQAENGEAALKLLEANPDVRVMLVDFNMPGMDGFTLARQVRRKHKREHLAIIGTSTQGDRNLAARFIKHGANDFLYKPFVAEELYCRVDQNIVAQDQLHRLEESAHRDYLTGLFNRRYFYSAAKTIVANAHRGNLTVCVAMLDIDHFKSVNDTYGHDVGDEVIKGVSGKLASRFRASDIVARLGGEEFCVVCANMAEEFIPKIFNELRVSISELRFPTDQGELSITVSIGVTALLLDSLDEMIADADRLLYVAKRSGRNRVEMELSE